MLRKLCLLAWGVPQHDEPLAIPLITSRQGFYTIIHYYLMV